MGKGRTKGGKAQKGTDEAWQHAQEVNEKRKADGKDTRSTASISRSLRRAQQHHEAKAKPVPEPARTRSRSPARAAKAKVVEDSSSYYEETEAEPPQPSAAPKATGEHLPGQKLEKLEEQCASGAGRVQAKGESLPKAERPEADEAQQGEQVARTGESLLVSSQTSGPLQGS